MPYVHVQSGIYHDPAERRYYVFLQWHSSRGHHHQLVDFATVAEASCFLAGALSASQASNKAIRLETLSPKEYERATRGGNPA
jgi:hypothetical protein